MELTALECLKITQYTIKRTCIKAFGLIILHMPSDNCNNAHVTELRCVIIGNFRFSNRYQSEEYEMALFKV